jgi:hypothetical protein
MCCVENLTVVLVVARVALVVGFSGQNVFPLLDLEGFGAGGIVEFLRVIIVGICQSTLAIQTICHIVFQLWVLNILRIPPELEIKELRVHGQALLLFLIECEWVPAVLVVLALEGVLARLIG